MLAMLGRILFFEGVFECAVIGSVQGYAWVLALVEKGPSVPVPEDLWSRFYNRD